MKCDVVFQGAAGEIRIKDGVCRSESIFPVDRRDENDIFAVAAVPKTMHFLRSVPPFCDMGYGELVWAVIDGLVKAQGDLPTREHTAELAGEYEAQIGPRDE